MDTEIKIKNIFLMLIISIFLGCAPNYPIHIYRIGNGNVESLSTLFIPSPLVPLSVDGKPVNFANRKGRSWEVLELKAGIHKIEVKYVSVHSQAQGLTGYITTTTTTAGPWTREISMQPGLLYFFDYAYDNENDKYNVTVYEGGPTTLTSPDGERTISFLSPDNVGKSELYYVVRDKITQKEKMYKIFLYPNQKPIFSPDKNRIAFLTKKQKYAFVVDGIEELPFDRYADPIFSPDNKIFAYYAKIGKKVYPIINGIKGKPYDRLTDLVFSSRGNYGFIGENDDKCTVVIDGKESEFYDDAYSLTFCPDASRNGYIAKLNGMYVAIIDGKMHEAYESVKGLEFSPDCKTFSYQIKENNSWFLINNGQKSRGYDQIYKIKYSSSGKRAAFVAKKAEKFAVIIDGKESKFYEDAWNPHFSGDDKNVAFIAKQGEDFFVVLNGEEKNKYSQVQRLKFNKENDKLIYYVKVKKDDQWEIVVEELNDL